MKARALSIRQPWATLIVDAGKDIENRCWATKMRGPFLVHAAKGMTRDEWKAAMDFAVAAGVSKDRLWDLCSPLDSMRRGGIIGYAEITDCIGTDRHEILPPAERSRWFMGEYGFRLANVRALPFLPLTGRLGFFEVELPDGYLPPQLAARFA